MTGKKQDVNSTTAEGKRVDKDSTEEVLPPGTAKPLPKLGDSLRSTITLIEQRMNKQCTPIPLPWPEVGNALSGGRGGVWPGLHMLVANTGTFKTQFLLSCMLHAATRDEPIPCAYCGLEMSRPEVDMRVMGLAANVMWSKLFHGTCAREDMTRCAEAAGRLFEAPIHIDIGEAHGWQYDRVEAVAKFMRETYNGKKYDDKPMLLGIDYLQLVSGRERQDAREVMKLATAHARQVATRYNMAVVMVSSTARSNYNTTNTENKDSGGRKTEPFGEGDPARFIALGKESGDIEYNVDSLMVLGRANETREHDGQWITPMALGLAKMRAGKPLWVRLWSNGSRIADEQQAKTAGWEPELDDGPAESEPSKSKPNGKSTPRKEPATPRVG